MTSCFDQGHMWKTQLKFQLKTLNSSRIIKVFIFNFWWSFKLMKPNNIQKWKNFKHWYFLKYTCQQFEIFRSYSNLGNEATSQVSSNFATSWFRSFVELIWNDPYYFKYVKFQSLFYSELNEVVNLSEFQNE